MINKLPDIKSSFELLDIIYKDINKFTINCKINKPIILYGAGNLGKMAKEYFNKLDIPFLFVMDKNASQCEKDPYWEGISVIHPEIVSTSVKKSCRIINCIVTSPYNEIEDYLNEIGFDDVIPFYDITLLYQEKHPLNNGWITGSLNEIDIKNIKSVLSTLNDDISRAQYLQFIAWHSLREEWIFKDSEIIHDNRYFIPEIVSILNNDETFVDIGAYHGEVTIKFINIVKNKYNNIYMIEPDVKNINMMLDNICEEKNIFNVKVIKKALGKEKEISLFYYGLEYSSKLSKLSEDTIDVEKLDNLNISPTFVKIHTEGNEDDVIIGGLETIKRYRPIIVATCYHNRNGLWKIQKLLIESLENYIYYFRLHNWCGTGAVIYAIPKWRIYK